VSDELARYLRSTLLASMGLSRRPFRLEAPPQAGTSSRLTLLRIEGMPPLLMRRFRHRSQGERNVRALRHLESLGLQAPRLVFHNLALRDRWRERGHAAPLLTVETWIDGTRVSDVREEGARREALIRIARLLARYREITRPFWGRPGRIRLLPYSTHCLMEARRMTRRVRAAGRLDSRQAGDMLRAFSRWRSVLQRLDRYNLVHKDVNPDNFILGAAGRPVPVDVHRIAYEPFPEEVLNALQHFCPGDEDAKRVFLDTYFAGAHQERALYEATRGFFEPAYYLKKIYRRVVDPAAERAEKLEALWLSTATSVRSPGTRPA